MMAAVDDGDHLVCTGSKIWTTHAAEANWIFALVRTTRGARKQQGITFLLIDMTTPGIEIRLLVMTSGEEIQTQIFFDSVRVPKSNVIGKIDDGWTVAKYLLEFERGGGAAAPALQVMAERIATEARTQPRPGGGTPSTTRPSPRNSPTSASGPTCWRSSSTGCWPPCPRAANPGAASSMLKILSTELSQAITELAMEAAAAGARLPTSCHPARRPDRTLHPAGRRLPSAVKTGRRSLRCATSTTVPAQSMRAATRFSATSWPKRPWDQGKTVDFPI